MVTPAARPSTGRGIGLGLVEHRSGRWLARGTPTAHRGLSVPPRLHAGRCRVSEAAGQSVPEANRWPNAHTRVKSKAGRRRIKLPSLVVAQLRDVRKQWMENRIKAGDMWQERWGDLVFAQSIGAPMDASKDRKAWADVLAAARIEGRRLYDARHSTATLLLEEGGDLQQVKDLLGHSQIAISSRYYVHATDRLAIDTANRLGAALFGTDAGSSSGSSSG